LKYQLGERRVECRGEQFIAHNATLIGSVVLEHEVSVWFNAVIRGDNEPILIGEGSNVQDGAVLHTDPGFPLTVGAFCTVGHRAILHGCTLEDGVLVGMGAIVMNGARIGAGALIGAGAMVTEGMLVPPGSLVIGVPGRVRRTLEPARQAALRGTAEHYVRNARRFRSGLAPA
jgi:carbonic anhydrase/acetyltransferase-like protein (isoleucine patch superfamily)